MKIFIHLAICLNTLLSGCDRKDTIVVTELKLSGSGSAISPNSLDVPSLPKKESKLISDNLNCLHRETSVGKAGLIGVCIDPNQQVVLVYRGFSPRFHAELGISSEIKGSREFEEMQKLVTEIEQLLIKMNYKVQRGPTEAKAIF